MTAMHALEIVSVVDEGLGHSSHVVGLGDGTALVIDPARFPTRQSALAIERGWRVAWTADTHSHADYISGSPELAQRGAIFLASAGAALEIAHRPVASGEEVEVADAVVLRAIATPGHTPDHLAYLLVAGDVPVALFSGGSLMVGAVGRTDLLGEERQEELARQLFRALQAEVLTLPDALAVYPTHGAGSFCSAAAGSARTTTIGHERASNPLLALAEDDFVEAALQGLGSYPAYFRELPEINRRGPRVYPSVPKLAAIEPAEARRHLEAGGLLVDARPISSFATAHAEGAISIEHRSVFGSWLGWLVSSDRPVMFMLDDSTDREDLVRQCLTVGHDAILGEVEGGMEAWATAGLPLRSVPLVDATSVSPTLIDVRQAAEWAAGHVPGAVHIELGSLPGSAPPAGPATIMCGHGERAMTGASLLEAAGAHHLSVMVGGPADWQQANGVELQLE